MEKVKKMEKLPEGWKRARLGEVTKSIKKVHPTGSYPYLEIGDIDIISKRYIIKEKPSPQHCLKATKDYIVVSKVRPTRGAIAQIKEEYVYVSPALLVLDSQNNNFLFYTLSRQQFFNYLGTRETGTTYPSVNDDDILDFVIFLPPLPEQEKIAEILETIDNAIEKTDRIIEKYKRIKQGLMQDLLTKGVRSYELGVMSYELGSEGWRLRDEKRDKFKDSPIGRIPEEWEVKRLGEVCEIVMGQSPPGETYNNRGLGMPFLQGKAEFGVFFPVSYKFTTSPIKIGKQGSVLISVRAPVGDVNISNIDYCIGRGLASLSFKNGNNIFLYYLLIYYKSRIETEGAGSTFEAINKPKLSKLLIPLPPLPEQHRIAKILSQIDSSIEKEQAYRQKLEHLKKGLMEDLLTGKVRVNNLLQEVEI